MGFILAFIFFSLTIIFFYERVKKRIKNKHIIEVLDIIRFLLLLIPFLLVFHIGINVLSAYNVQLSKNNQHILMSLVLFVLGNMLSSITVPILLDKLTLTSLVKKNDLIFLVPVLHSIIYIVYLINQMSNIFDEMKDPFSLLMSFVKNRLPMDHRSSATYISLYIILEVLFSIVYIIIVYTNKTNPKIMKLICNDSKLAKTCYKDISKDIFTFSLFFKVILVAVFFIYLMGSKAASAILKIVR